MNGILEFFAVVLLGLAFIVAIIVIIATHYIGDFIATFT